MEETSVKAFQTIARVFSIQYRAKVCISFDVHR